ncbi:MAG: hypothetical protein RLZZ08_1247 [Pseudomonadota bacterium]|jgi:hypothetical protein
MPQANFAYSPTLAGSSDCAESAMIDHDRTSLGASIFADRGWLRDEMRDDAVAAGLAVRECGAVADLLGGAVRPLGEMVLLDCPAVDAAMLAALAGLDERAARSGAQLIICTSVAALEDVFACCDQSQPQILVDAGRTDRVIALGQMFARLPGLRLRELSEEDRLHLLRLTEQVSRIAERLDRQDMAMHAAGAGGAFRLESPTSAYAGDVQEGDRLVRNVRPPLPDPRLVRQILRQRQLRARFFDRELFADPAWDILLDLTAARVEHVRVSITSLCIASGVPPTTALRWITQMTHAGLLQRVEDECDRRRVFITLSEGTADAMARYFVELGRSAAQMV